MSFPMVMLMKWQWVINIQTKINIFFDSSGSMDSTLSPLTTMKNTILKDRLLPYYNNDSDLYDEKVTITNFINERTFDRVITTPPDPWNVINLVFQDEAEGFYYSWSFTWTRNSTYNTDITNLRTLLSSYWAEKYKTAIFQVQWDNDFKTLLSYVQNWIGNYAVPYWLSDKLSQFSFIYDVIAASTPTYYANLITDTLDILF